MTRVGQGNRRNKNHKPPKPPTRYEAGFMTAMDRRTEVYKTLQLRYEAIVEDLGGPSDISLIKASLIERYLWLQMNLETLELDMATGEVDRAVTIGKWVAGVNSLVGLARMLGLERIAPTESLTAYLNQKAASDKDEGKQL